jgi:hypothetical protein
MGVRSPEDERYNKGKQNQLIASPVPAFGQAQGEAEIAIY